MANVNKVMLIGRLTRDPEFRSFSTGGRVAKLGFAVTNRKKNAQTGQWDDDPMFIDCEVYNRGETGKQADLIERFALHKGSQLFIEGRLVLDSWDDKTSGQKRTKHKIVVDNFQLLDPKTASSGSSSGSSYPAKQTAPAQRYDEPPADDYGSGDGENPPF